MPHDAARPHAHRAARAEPAGQPRQDADRSGGDARGQPNPRQEERQGFQRLGWPHPRTRDGSGDDDHRPAPDQPRNRGARRRRVVRESAAIRRVRRDVADSLRHGTQGQAAQADACGLSDARHRRVPDRSPDDLRGRRRGELHDARHLLSPERVHDWTEPLPLRHGNRIGRGKANDDQPDRDWPPLPAPGPPRRPRVRPSDHQWTRGGGRGGVHAGRRPGRRRPARRDHGHRNEYRVDPRQQGTDPRSVVPCGPGLRRGSHRLRHARARRRGRRREPGRIGGIQTRGDRRGRPGRSSAVQGSST